MDRFFLVRRLRRDRPGFSLWRPRSAVTFVSLLLSMMILTGSCSLSQVNFDTRHFFSEANPASVASDASPRTVLVHLFEWRWDDIAQECETFLGPNGYAAVQISPPQEHVIAADERFPWWQRYQPVSYKLVSRSGDRAQLANMIRRCHNAGVQVYADAVINHMAGVNAGVGSAGSPFTKYNYPGIYSDADFNACRQNIDNYQDRDMVTQCELVGLADLNVASSHVQRQIGTYLLDLISLGIDGFRIDAAKHIRAKDLGIVLQHLREQVEPDPYVYQEVIDPGNEAIKKVEYYSNGDVFEFEYGRIIGESFLGLNNRNLAQLETLGESWGLMPADKAVVFIDNHDKQRGHGGGGIYLTHKQPSLYSLANVFMLAFPYGYPQVMSSYPFATSDQGPPADPDGTTHAVFANGASTCGQEWVCEHHWSAIAPMVRFRNRTDGQPLTHWWTNGSNQIAFGRGDRGFVVINRDGRPLTHRFQTGLPAGEYCNLLAESCTERLRVGRDGQVEATVPGMGAIALVRSN